VQAVFAAAAAALALSSSQPGASGRIAFVLRTDVNRIYSIRPDGTGLRRLSSLPRELQRGGDVKPAWSPDGRWIAFARDVPARGSDRLWLCRMRADGSGLRQLTGGPGPQSFDSSPAWSPDGRRIAFVRASAPAARLAWIYVASAGGGREEALTQGAFDFAPAWSADGATLAYLHGLRGSVDGQLVLDTLAAPRAEATSIAAADLAWSRDGRIAYVGIGAGARRTCYRHLNTGRLLLGFDAMRRFAPRACRTATSSSSTRTPRPA
jgi:Tol biopolymer transport system component